jgi:uncharacterized protein (DUF58 family)
MIVPRNRLLFWVAAVLLPFALLAAIAPDAAPISIAFVVTLGVVVAADAAAARRSLAGIGIELPAVVRMSKDREAKLEMRIRNEQRRQRLLRVALDLPPEIRASTDEQDVILPNAAEWSRAMWTCTPLVRGKYFMDAAYAEGVSYLGFWSARKAFPVSSEIRVYPNLLAERKNLAALFLNRGTGFHVQRQVGKGRDFEKLREYVSGDSFDEIHWKATARRARPITKVFQIERTQEIYLVIDASRLSARETATGGTTILERLVTCALVLGLAAEQQGDLFGVISFTDKVERFVRARTGKGHYSACRDALYTLQPRTVSPDFDELCTFIRLRLRRRALVIFLTSLDDPALAESFVRNVDLIRRQHLVMVNMIRQPGTALMFTNPDIESDDDLYQQIGGHLRWQKLRQLEKTLYRRGVHFSLIENERLSADVVSQYLGIKQRQLI